MNPGLTYNNLPASSSDAQRRLSTTRAGVDEEEGLMSVMSQVAWQADLNVGHRLSPVSSLHSATSLGSADDSHVSTAGQRQTHDQGRAIHGHLTADLILTYRIILGLVDVCMSGYFQLMSADGDRTVTRGRPNPFKLSVNYCHTVA